MSYKCFICRVYVTIKQNEFSYYIDTESGDRKEMCEHCYKLVKTSIERSNNANRN